MNLDAPYTLPTMLGDQYMLSKILRMTSDTIIYAAQQKDIRRDVIIESLHPDAMQDDDKVIKFLKTAKAQTRLKDSSMSTFLELLFVDETWHMVKERIKGEPLDMLLASGRTLSTNHICELLKQVCYCSIYMDIEGIANASFSLEHCYFVEHGFRFDNIAVAGARSRTSSRQFLQRAAAKVEPLLDADSPFANSLSEVIRRIRYAKNWEPLSALYFADEVSQLNMRSLWNNNGESRESS